MYLRDTTGKWVSPGRQPQTPPNFSLVHPGVMYDNTQLTLMATEAADSTTNRAAKYSTMLSRPTNYVGSANNPAPKAYGDLGWIPTPWATVFRGKSGTGGGTVRNTGGDSDLLGDGTAALVDALAWRIKGDRARASKSCDILNAWSSTITSILMDATDAHSDGKLLAGWTGTLFARAGELMANSGWTAGAGETTLQKSALQNKLMTVWIPLVNTVWGGAGVNWHTSMGQTYVDIGVFCDDDPTYQGGLTFMRSIVPSTIWLTGDHNKWSWASASTPPSSGLPISMPGTGYDKASGSLATPTALRSYWHDPTSWPTALHGEIGRDFHHTSMGFAGTGYACETARIQGDDLWTEFQSRLVPSAEMCTKFFYDVQISGVNPPASWPFAGSATFFGTSMQRATYELLYMHYHDRKGVSMPNTLAWLNAGCRGSTWDIDQHVVSEELTYRGNTG
jgi:hypothetical protein